MDTVFADCVIQCFVSFPSVAVAVGGCWYLCFAHLVEYFFSGRIFGVCKVVEFRVEGVFEFLLFDPLYQFRSIPFDKGFPFHLGPWSVHLSMRKALLGL